MTVLLTLLALAGEDNRDKVLYLYKTFHKDNVAFIRTIICVYSKFGITDFFGGLFS